MKYIQPMTCSEFTKYLLTLKTGDTIDFGCEPGCDWPNEVPNVNDVEEWYFAKVIKIPEYGSRFILIDYAGGESAFAIPLNCYCDHCDADDTCIVPGYVEQFFAMHFDDPSDIKAHVFVEMEEPL